MIVGAAVCPGAPLLIDGVAGRLVDQLAPLAAACALAVSRLPECDAVLLLTTGAADHAPGAGGSWQVLPPGAVIPTTSIGRSDLPRPRSIRLSSGAIHRPGPTAREPAVGTIVGASLLSTAAIAAAVTAVEVIGDPAAAGAVLAARTASDERIAVLVIADGSACHGDSAPGRRDDRADPFDAALAEALATGAPDRLALACADRDLALELLAGVDPLAVLAALTAGRPPDVAELLYSSAPLGVGYLVASWGWTDS